MWVGAQTGGLVGHWGILDTKRVVMSRLCGPDPDETRLLMQGQTHSTSGADLTPRIPSRLEAGKIVPPSNLELIVADHCNIACRQCNHASPVMKKWNATAESVARDLAQLAPLYRPRMLRILGGEPILNPQITEIIRVARDSGIAEHLQLVTNGLLLDRLDDAAWDLLSEVEISIYPAAGMTEAMIDKARMKGIRHNTVVSTCIYPQFRMTFCSQPAQDKALVEDIWMGCKMAQVWGCHAVRDGFIYRCPQSIYISMLGGAQGSAEGLSLDDEPTAPLQPRLLAFLNAAGPLRACSQCAGSSGKTIEQVFLVRRDWQKDLDISLSEMVDQERLSRNLQEIIQRDDCRVPVREKRLSKTYLLRKIMQLVRPARAVDASNEK